MYKVESTVCKISKLRWKSDNDSSWICGTIDNYPSNVLMIYALDKTPKYDDLEIQKLGSVNVPAGVSQLCTFNSNYLLVLLNNGQVLLKKISQTSFTDLHSWKNLTPFSFNDVIYHKPMNCAITAGQDGLLHFFNILNIHSPPTKSQNISGTSLTCLDLLNQNEIICGNEAGYLKVVDVRQQKASLSLGKCCSNKSLSF